MQKIRVHWGMFGNQSGYSQAAQDYVLSLEQSGKFDVSIEVIGGKLARPAVTDTRYEKLMKLTQKEKSTSSMQIYHCIPTIQNRIKPLKFNIGFAVFETFSPPKEWIKILSKNDAVFCPSTFNYRTFAHTQIKSPMFYLPHIVDTQLYNPTIKPLYNYDKFTFLFMGSWKVRKGYVQLIEAWIKEFSDKDNVQLVIKTDKAEKAKTYFESVKKNILSEKEGIAPIIFEKSILDEQTLPRMMKSCHCLISPTLGEGFGLPGLQCMALDIPIIITDFSGCQDYATNSTAILLPVTGYILHRNLDKIPQFDNKKWAFVKVDDIRKKMRYALNNQKEITEKSKRASQYVLNNFSYQNNAERFLEITEILHDRIKN